MTNQQDSNNRQNLPSQEQRQRSLNPIDGEKWITTYYPLISDRKEPISSFSVALKDQNTLALVDRRLGEGIALKWVKAQLLDTFRICGAGKSVISYQVVTIARRIRMVYYYLSLSELTYFFEAFVGGNFGTLYVGDHVNPQNIMEALKAFDTERANRLSEIEVNKANEIKKENKEVDIDRVNEICKRLRLQINKNKFNQK